MPAPGGSWVRHSGSDGASAILTASPPVWQVEAKTVKAAQRKEARKRRAKDAREKPWRDKEKAAPAFSFTDYVKYQDAIKAVLKRRKWKRKLAQGKNPPLPVI